MITKRRLLWVGIGCVAAAALAIAAYAIETRDTPNALGLTHSDLAYGGFPNVEALRNQTKSVADSYLAQNEVKLRELCGGPYHLAFDQSLSPKTRALGYPSSFYYYCWDIYLPYSLQPVSGGPFTILVHLSDATNGHQHDPAKFRVLRTIVLDREGRTEKTFE